MTIAFKRTDPNERPLGKIADATIKFDDVIHGPLGGCSITGFTLWEPEDGTDTAKVTLPARVYSINGERRRFELIRPADADASTQPLRDAIAAAWLRAGEKTGEVDL